MTNLYLIVIIHKYMSLIGFSFYNGLIQIVQGSVYDLAINESWNALDHRWQQSS